MEDLTAALQNFLGSEEGAKQLEELSKMLGLDSPEEKKDNSDIGGMLNGLFKNEENDAPPFTPADILKFQKLIKSFQNDNPNTVFLKSLKPLLKEERQQKVEEAVRIMKLLSVLPELRESGMLNNLLA